jgi:hypothetical protein
MHQFKGEWFKKCTEKQLNLFHTGRPEHTNVWCKELAKGRTATGKINWNSFETGDPRWYAPAATIMLSGKTKNKYGTTVPFTVECRGTSSGTVEIVEIKQ